MDGACLVLMGMGILAGMQLVLLGLQAYEHRRFAAGRLRHRCLGQVTGSALVVIPCRGLERNLESNLRRFFQQDYPHYQLRFVTQSADDPATVVIQKLMAENPGVAAELIIAGPAESEAQKVHNLRMAIRSLPSSVEYLVFADSDAAPSPCWLRALVSRLESSGAAAVTGYRWFIPEVGDFREAVVYSLNAAYAMLMTRKTPNLVWGGSWAMRRQMFDALGIREAWKGQICDDLAVARLLQQHNLHVEYEPSCLVPTVCQASFREMMAFVMRQYFLLRYVLPNWWLFDTFIGNFYVLIFWIAAITSLLGREPGQVIGAMIAAILYVLFWIRAEFRAAATRVYFPEVARTAAFRRVVWWDRLCGPLIGLLGFLASVSAGLRRTITWRGITYRMLAGGRVQICYRQPAEGAGSESQGPEAATGLTPNTCRLPSAEEPEPLAPAA